MARSKHPRSESSSTEATQDFINHVPVQKHSNKTISPQNKIMVVEFDTDTFVADPDKRRLITGIASNANEREHI